MGIRELCGSWQALWQVVAVGDLYTISELRGSLASCIPLVSSVAAGKQCGIWQAVYRW